MAPNARDCLISTVAQMETLASPIRHQTHLVMETLGECTVAQIADRLGRKPESLYYHLHALERANIVVRSGTRIVGSREEALYRLRGRCVRIDTRQGSKPFRRAIAKGCGCLLRYAERTFVSVLLGPRGAAHRRRGTLWIRQLRVSLNPAAFKDLQDRLDDLEAFLTAEDRPGEDRTFLVTMCVSPMNEGESREDE